MTTTSTIAILSIGQMGLGIASLLRAHNYRVITNVRDRSAATQDRAQKANIECVQSDQELVNQADYVLSIVPPRDAIATARRVEEALLGGAAKREIHYLDLNAISPQTARSIAQSLASHAPNVHFIDGGIIGGPPRSSATGWTKPGIPLSGPSRLPDTQLADVLNARYVGDEVGKASGLKCCFAALSKGFTALALQSFTTAAELGVVGALEDYLAVYNAAAGEKAKASIVGCTTKAYRWVEEMNQIGETFAQEGGWREQAKVFREVAGVFQGLADVVEREGTGGMGDVKGVVERLGEGLKKGEGV